MSEPSPQVDEFLERAKKWQGEMLKLRSILLGCGLEEELKWGKPCYAAGGKNVAIVQPFKDFLSLMFFKGALLIAVVQNGMNLMGISSNPQKVVLGLVILAAAVIDRVKQGRAAE